MTDRPDGLLDEVRQTLTDAEADISDAVSALESDDRTQAEDRLGSAMSRIKILKERIRRHTEGSEPT
jgi:hypothetical protein